jgi:peptidoglycan/LPS O-acetylase OafA/YrhL
MKYIKGLDTLRAFAVMFVIMYHWGLPIQDKSVSDFLREIIPDGRFGVDLFFVLSGFLITAILLDARSAGRTRLEIIRNFMIRRILRVFPAYYLTLMILVWIGYPFIQKNLGWFLSYSSNILSFRNKSWNDFSHSWSLSVEEQFYLIWPWCIVYVGGKYLRYVFTAALLIGIGTIVYVSKIHVDAWGLLLTPACMVSFGIGGMYAWLSQQPRGTRVFMRVITLLVPIAVILHFYWVFSVNGGHFNYLARLANSLISIWLIHKIITLRPGWLKSKVLENPVLNKIGQISYGLYLFHYNIPSLYQQFITDHFSGDPATLAFLSGLYAAWVIKLAFLLLLTFTSFYLFERPIVNLKKRVGYTRRRQPEQVQVTYQYRA